MIEPALEQQIAEFLAAQHTASLATIDEHGHPHAANVWYVSHHHHHDHHHQDHRHQDYLALSPWWWWLYFVSSPASAHIAHLAHQNRVALTVYAQTDNPQEIHGLQMHGVCEPVAPGPAREEAWKLYAARFPVVAATPALTQAVEAQQFYGVRVTWRRWIDNRRGFGFKVEAGADV